MTQAGAPPRTATVMGDWLTLGRFALLLAGLIFAAFPQVVLGLQTFVTRDYGFFVYPLAHYQRECFWRGELPLWNPYSNCGLPFLAQWNSMPLYPPALFYLLLPLGWSLSFFTLLHLFWAGLGMYCLAHRWTGHRLGAALAGLIFAFNGLSLNFLMWPSHMATLSWMPWVILLVQKAWQQGGRALVLAALAGALQMLAGGPETILFTWLLLLALWVLALRRAFSGPRPSTLDPRLVLVRFPLVVLLISLLAAAQLFPFLDLAAHSQRNTGYADARWSMPGWGWANFLVPMAFGTVWNKNIFFQYDQFWTSSYYLGVGTLLLGWLALWSVPKRGVRLLAVAGGLSFLLAVGEHSPLYGILSRLVPQLSLMRYPVKFITVLVFAAPLLAAFALARLPELAPAERPLWRRRVLATGTILVLLIGAILLWAWRFPFATDDFPATLRNGLSRIPFLAGTVILLFALTPLGGAGTARPAEAADLAPAAEAPLEVPKLSGFTRGQLLCPVLLLLLFWLDAWTHVPPQNPTVPGWIYQPGLAQAKLALDPAPALGQSRAMLSPLAQSQFYSYILSDLKNNLLVKRLGYFANCNLLDEVPKVNGFFSLYPRECGELDSVLYNSTNAFYPRLADFMAVSQVSAPNELYKWQARTNYLPWATAGQAPVFLDDTNAERALLRPDFKPAEVVYLPLAARPLVSVTNQTRARVLAQRFAPQRVDLEVEAAQTSLVVIAQTWYHRWRAYVDEQPAALLRANYAFQAVQVPPGTHRVRLAYEDRPFQWGAVLSGLTLAGCLVAWARCRARA